MQDESLEDIYDGDDNYCTSIRFSAFGDVLEIPVESDEEIYGSQCTALREMREWQDFREGLDDEATAALAKSKKQVDHYMRSSEDSENAEAELDRSRSAHGL